VVAGGSPPAGQIIKKLSNPKAKEAVESALAEVQ
jgi:hypothetical protein